MQRISKVLLAGLVYFSVAAVFAQGPPPPGPEHKKLEYFVGNWTTEGDMKPGPMGPGGKFSGTDHVESLDGGYFIVFHSEVALPGMGKVKELAVMGYNPEDKKYTYNAFSSMGENEKAAGTVSGDEWSWTDENKMGDMVMKGHYTVKIVSPNSYTFKYEVSPDGSSWTTVMEGKATKK